MQGFFLFFLFFSGTKHLLQVFEIYRVIFGDLVRKGLIRRKSNKFFFRKSEQKKAESICSAFYALVLRRFIPFLG